MGYKQGGSCRRCGSRTPCVRNASRPGIAAAGLQHQASRGGPACQGSRRHQRLRTDRWHRLPLPQSGARVAPAAASSVAAQQTSASHRNIDMHRHQVRGVSAKMPPGLPAVQRSHATVSSMAGLRPWSLSTVLRPQGRCTCRAHAEQPHAHKVRGSIAARCIQSPPSRRGADLHAPSVFL